MTKISIDARAIDRRRLLTQAGTAVAVGMLTEVARARARAEGFEAIGFDAFTIFDPRSTAAAVEESFPGKGKEIFSTWRLRQFEYCWLRTLNRNYADFRQVTEEALVFACKSAKVDLDASARAKLMEAAFRFKPWPELGRRAEIHARRRNPPRLCVQPHPGNTRQAERRRRNHGAIRATTEHRSGQGLQTRSARL